MVEASLRIEFGAAASRDEDKRALVGPLVDDWLFDPTGQGSISGLPLRGRSGSAGRGELRAAVTWALCRSGWCRSPCVIVGIVGAGCEV